MAFLVAVIIAYGMGTAQNPRLLYLLLMFALCSTSVIDLDGLNGRYSLLGIFLAVYFIMYGLGDLSSLLKGPPTETSRAPLSNSELLILVGGVLVIVLYRSACSITGRAQGRAAPRDWTRNALLFIGILFWCFGTYSIYQWNVHIVTDTTNEAFHKGIHSHGSYEISAYMLGQMIQPLGVLLLAYAWRTYRSATLLWLVVAIVALQIILGFIVDQKGLAMMGGTLVVVTCVLLEGRIPRLWLLGGVVYVLLVYPVFVAARVEIVGERGIARSAKLEHLGKVLQIAIASRDRVSTGSNRQMTFFERMSMRSSVETFVNKAGTDVPFAHGYTLTPLLATFIPKVIWSDKPDIPTGQLFNKQFHVTEGEEVFLSPSYLGELYWNFGWPGALAGMMLFGAALGWIGCRFNLADGATVTRLLVTAVTIKQMIISFEGDIAPTYVVMLRSLAGIGLLHLALARVPMTMRWFGSNHSDQSSLGSSGREIVRAFPNLLT